MTKIKLLGAIAVATTMLAGSAMAQTAAKNPGRCSAQDVNCQNLRQASPSADRSYRHRRMSNRQTNRDLNNDWNRTQTGFWPADVAGNVAGAAIGTAGAIATAPFRAMDNSYAYYNSWDRRTYAERNGFVCTPGTMFKGADGQRHRCQ
jgi:hypothetical protein